jgi:hypothetical protein
MAGKTRPNRRPAQTDEAREQQLISQAMDLAERQIQDGSAPAQVMMHFVKMGSSREKLEQARLARENQLLDAKVDNMASGKRVEELYGAAIEAMRHYAGHHDEDDYDNEDF